VREASENQQGAEKLSDVGAQGLCQCAAQIAMGRESGVAGDEIAAKGVGPDGFEAGEVGVVVFFPAGGGALMVENFACVGDVMAPPEAVHAQAQIHVLATVDVSLVKPAGGKKGIAPGKTAGGGDGAPTGNRLGAGERRGVAKVLSVVDRREPGREDHAEVIVAAGGGDALDVADEAGVGVRLKRGEHGLKPAKGELGIVVEQAEQFAAGEGGGAVVIDSKVALLLVKHDAIRGRQGLQEITGAVRGDVIHDDHFMVDDAGERGFKGRQALAGELKAVIYRHEDAEPRSGAAGAGKRLKGYGRERVTTKRHGLARSSSLTRRCALYAQWGFLSRVDIFVGEAVPNFERE